MIGDAGRQWTLHTGYSRCLRVLGKENTRTVGGPRRKVTPRTTRLARGICDPAAWRRIRGLGPALSETPGRQRPAARPGAGPVVCGSAKVKMASTA